MTLCVVAGSLSMAQTCVLPPAGLVAWWPGDGNPNDISGHDNNGELNNGAIAYATGQVAEALGLDGVDDFVKVDNRTLGGREARRSRTALGRLDHRLAWFRN
jgi:hypothetical protein